MERRQGVKGAKNDIKVGSLGRLENLLRHLGEINNPRQMASNKPIPSTMAMMEPKAKKKYKTKKEKKRMPLWRS